MTADQDRKRLVRGAMRERLLATPPTDFRAWSSSLRRVIEGCPEFGRARTLLAFWPTVLGDLDLGVRGIPEPDIRPLLDRALGRGVRVCLPRIDWSACALIPARILNPSVDLTTDRYGLSVPSSACPLVAMGEIDAILVPGVAFDAAGHRLGRGGGFYDRLLAPLDRARTACLGVCFEAQLLTDIPRSAHDARVDKVLTESREIRV